MAGGRVTQSAHLPPRFPAALVRIVGIVALLIGVASLGGPPAEAGCPAAWLGVTTVYGTFTLQGKGSQQSGAQFTNQTISANVKALGGGCVWEAASGNPPEVFTSKVSINDQRVIGACPGSANLNIQTETASGPGVGFVAISSYRSTFAVNVNVTDTYINCDGSKNTSHGSGTPGPALQSLPPIPLPASVGVLRGTKSFSAESDDLGLPAQWTMSWDLTPVSAIPTISGPDTVWWFNDEQQPGYKTSIDLKAEPDDQGPYRWNIVSDNREVLFPNGSSSITTAANTVTVVSNIPSPPKTKNDVSITVTVAGSTSKPHTLTVLTPYALTRLAPMPSCKPYSGLPRLVGFTCLVCYSIQDQNMTRLPSKVYVNEDFTGPLHPDYKDENWRRGKACGESGQCPSQYPSRWCDQITFAAIPNMGTIPQPQVPPRPPTPFKMVKVVDWPGKWSVGSPTPGKGKVVQTNVWQFYQDHGDHIAIKSPP